MMEAHLSLAPPPEFDGEFTVENFGRLIKEHRQLRLLLQRAEDRLKGADLEIARLKADEEQKALKHPYRQHAEILALCWRSACNRRRDPSAAEMLTASNRVKKLGFGRCLTAVAGAAFDPGERERRNGTVELYNDFELIFRTEPKTQSFIDRAPRGFQPNPAKVAAISGVEVDLIEKYLNERKR